MPRKHDTKPVHDAIVGLEHYLRKTPEEHRGTAGRELATQTGMSKLDMFSYMGKKVKEGQKAAVPKEEDRQQEQRLGLLHAR